MTARYETRDGMDLILSKKQLEARHTSSITQDCFGFLTSCASVLILRLFFMSVKNVAGLSVGAALNL